MPYPWPASSLTPHEMALLYSVSQHTSPRIPITRLVGHAIRETYAGETGAISAAITRLDQRAVYTLEKANHKEVA